MSGKRKQQNRKEANGQKALFFGTIELSKKSFLGLMLLQISFLKVFKLESVKKRRCRIIVFSKNSDCECIKASERCECKKATVSYHCFQYASTVERL